MIDPKEWLTFEIAVSYQIRANKTTTIKQRRKLIAELRERCSVTELEATNILNGFNIRDYVRKYEIIKEKQMDILINGEAVKRKRRIRTPYRPPYDPDQVKLKIHHEKSLV